MSRPPRRRWWPARPTRCLSKTPTCSRDGAWWSRRRRQCRVYAVQLAVQAGAQVIATGRSRDLDRIRALGAAEVVSADDVPPSASRAGPTRRRHRGGRGAGSGFRLVAAWRHPPVGSCRTRSRPCDKPRGASRFILVAVTTDKLRRLAALFEEDRLRTNIGREFRLSDARLAHRLMEDGGGPPRKLVLVPDRPDPSKGAQ